MQNTSLCDSTTNHNKDGNSSVDDDCADTPRSKRKKKQTESVSKEGYVRWQAESNQ
ncbi:hypothetical protein PPTG_01411 [Phytophthora nicotianae INRA-310]|uniref:Uncharacterized protein n=1 Tax=Phytophthora nicotianae (strain INRA-310) TaxID=761204 RepID=W2R6U3_PHYN3|nr:hypothetical protein PPTG_01411 [Phytophthora nicotianae INRA-310]ETN21128.1 hypothetical protein PPTG_01411 [Phytophthora nicotianae INRA-310]